MKILAAEDNPVFQSMLKSILIRWGYQVVVAKDGDEALRALQADDAPRLAILDWMMPGIDGVDVCRRVRAVGREPYIYILLLTARTDSEDLVEGMDSGADDYLTKPFSGRELLARLRAILRRVQPAAEETVVHIGEVEIDFTARLVRRAGAEVKLTAKEYDLLRYLAQHRGRVVTHQQILRELWGANAEDNTHYLRVYMTHLRQKLEPDPRTPRFLKTESGVGYRLVDA